MIRDRLPKRGIGGAATVVPVSVVRAGAMMLPVRPLGTIPEAYDYDGTAPGGQPSRSPE